MFTLLLITGALAACKYQNTVEIPIDIPVKEEDIKKTLSEVEFVAETQICQDYALEVALVPGKVVCSGDIGGEQVVIEIIPKVEDGVVFFYVAKYVANGAELPEDAYDDFSIDLLTHVLALEDFYPISSVFIVEGEMILTRNIEQ
jgi:hypothetical protein